MDDTNQKQYVGYWTRLFAEFTEIIVWFTPTVFLVWYVAVFGSQNLSLFLNSFLARSLPIPFSFINGSSSSFTPFSSLSLKLWSFFAFGFLQIFISSCAE